MKIMEITLFVPLTSKGRLTGGGVLVFTHLDFDICNLAKEIPHFVQNEG
jgi:hypothetical protein